MKKSVIILSTAFVLFTNASITANCKSLVKNPVTFSSYSVSPLHIAISKGDIETVKKNIEYGDDVNKMSRDMSPLMVAARYNKVEIIKILLQNGADLKLKNEKGFTALNYAEFSKAAEAVAVLSAVK
ncbi:ankyrin repeat domain-containing protein [Flavobacterium reichenbachii]|uniref:Ankyrin n=1 Tax=Flavobacterium reichenbachii TaxID=362418 RepID=A0A085ZE52_9FLAO|nr:ankyrin repeat domain-containing protein [Flavobacterium reichenbachii]KFF02716.1 ankyrin [Flavobacterium reichenbachii]OXB10749.1 hypothetical protein B0A68_22010 [Flavobacterium reichenbachii]